MQGFKNLLKSNHYTEDALQSFNKKVQQFQKAIYSPLYHCQSLVMANQSSSSLLEKWVMDYNSCGVEDLRKSPFWLAIAQICIKLGTSQKDFSSKLRGSFIESSRQARNNSILQFQCCIELISKVRIYRCQEQAMLQSYKRFCKLHKNMLYNIQKYKKTFTDVKMIYNRQEKIKRYCASEVNYEEMMTQYNQIAEKLVIMSDSKKELIASFNRYLELIAKGIKSVSQKIQQFCCRYLELVYQKKAISINLFTNAIQRLSKVQTKIQFSCPISDKQAEEYLQPEINFQENQFIPKIIMNYQYLKETHLLNLGVLLLNYEKQFGELIRKKKIFNRQILQYFGCLIKGYEKIKSLNREFIFELQKRIKKYKELFGVQHFFIKAFSNTLNISETIQDRIAKQFSSKYKALQQLLTQQLKCLQTLHRDYKNFCSQRFGTKKDSKKKSFFEKAYFQVEAQLKKNENQLMKIETFDKMGNLKQIFEICYEKLKKISSQIKLQIEQVLTLLQRSTIEIYTAINVEKELERQINQTLNPKEGIIDEINLVRTKIFEQTIFAGLLNEEPNIITFDGGLNKVQQFKKLKKPQEIFQEKSETTEKLNAVESLERERSQKSMKQSQQKSVTAQKRQNKSKYQAFLISRTIFMPNQRYIQSYVCGLAYNFILAGRLYVTNERLCFYSKFNPKNIFFGETFIQIPKKDIKKIEKRQNVVVFDNSLSITTVNGEMFFTSFFSRDDAYDKILSALNLNFDEIMYEPEQRTEVVLEQETIAEEDDDIEQEVLAERAESIDSILKKLDYKDLMNTTLKFKDLTAFKYFKMFELNQEINYNRGKYLGFQGYFHHIIGHTEVSFQEWKPNLLGYLNSSNLKGDMPLSFKRTVKQVVPVTNTGIPFMPKTSAIEERITVYFYSKDKIIFEIDYKSFGVPYCDYFLLNFRKEIITTELNTVSFKMQFATTFITNTMMKGVIQSRSFEESRTTMIRLEEEMQKYLKFLEKATMKTNIATIINETANQHSTIEQSATEQLSSQIQSLKEENLDLKALLSVQRRSMDKTKKLFLASVILNIALLLLLFL